MSASTLTTQNFTWHIVSGLAPSLQDSSQFEELLLAARDIRRNAYAPYSNFLVGSAVLMDGNLYRGCNVENASYGATICAERSAIFAGIADGGRSIAALALTTGPQSGTPINQRTPCGICRQVIAEFAEADTPILIDAGEGASYAGEIVSLEQLLPWRFKL
jgi:cytidine deaminase